MPITNVQVNLDVKDATQTQLKQGWAEIFPTSILTGQILAAPAHVQVNFNKDGSVPSVSLVPTDSGLSPSGWAYTINLFSVGAAAITTWTFSLLTAGGSIQNLSTLTPVQNAATFQAYMPLPSGTPAARKLPFATGTTEASAWDVLAAADLPVVSGQFICAPHVYAPITPASPGVTSTTLAAFDTTNITTNTFVAPASGKVLVTASFLSAPPSTQNYSYALAAHNTVSPVVGNVITMEVSSLNVQLDAPLEFVVTGLTPGNTYQFDLLGAVAAGTLTIKAAGVTSTSPTGATGAPVVMKVQAI